MDTVSLVLSGTVNAEIPTVSIPRPTKCPRCKHAIGSNVLYSNRYSDGKEEYYIVVMFQCNNCFRPFICIYEEQININVSATGARHKSHEYTLINIGPVEIEKRDFGNDIRQLSSRFSDIYNQAYAAEQNGFTEVCGMAYGKALEFLVKDYAISRHSDKVQEISEMPLSRCIKEYVDGAKIQLLAERCAWLRNDETHYVRKHEDLDLTDLKKLLEGVIRAIEIDLLTDDAAEIQPKNHA